MKRETGSEKLKEEERGRAEASPVPAGSPPPPPISFPDNQQEVRQFIEVHVDEFLSGYRGGGGRPRTVVEATNCYLRKQNPKPIAQWWGSVLETVARYNADVMAGKTKAKESPWWFVDGYDTQAFGGVRRQFEPEDLGEDTEAERLKASGAREIAPVLSMPATSPPAVEKRCYVCEGSGWVEGVPSIPEVDRIIKQAGGNKAREEELMRQAGRDGGYACRHCAGRKAASA